MRWCDECYSGAFCGCSQHAVALVRSGKKSDARYIGSMPQAQLFWDIDRHLFFAAIYGHFFAGRFIKESGPGDDVDYITTLLTYKF